MPAVPSAPTYPVAAQPAGGTGQCPARQPAGPSFNILQSGQFVNVNTLTDSVADEQQAALAAAPSSDYDSSDNATVTVALTSLGDGTYSAIATDSDGDVGGGDTITVSPDGTSWSDNGMGWSGPDTGGDYWSTPTVSGITS